MNKTIFIHIPKTGGSTMKNIFRAQYKNNMKVIFPGFTLEDFQKLNKKEKSKINCLYGVFPFNIHNLFMDESIKYTSIIRDPVKRINSLYNYFCHDRAEGYYKIIPETERNSLNAFVTNIDKYTLVHGNNAQTRLIAGAHLNNAWDKITKSNVTNSNMLDIAIENIERYFYFVGTTERYLETLLLLKKHLTWQKPLYFIKRNVTKRRMDNISQSDIDLIKGNNSLDLQLYEYVNNKLIKEIKENKDYIEREKRKLEFNNRLYTFYRKNIRKIIK